MTPTQILKDLSNRYPEAWRQADRMRRDRGKALPTWPAWCYLPLGGWSAIASYGKDDPFGGLTDLAPLAALGTWRISKGIYQIEPDIFDALYHSPPKGDLPSEVLFRLPEWCVYIETPPSTMWDGNSMAGFFAHLEHDLSGGEPELRLLINPRDGGDMTAVAIHLGAHTLTEAIDRMVAVANRHNIVNLQPEIVETLSANTAGLLSVLLYLCSEEPDIQTPRNPGQRPQRAKGVKIKGQWMLLEASKVTIWQMGYNLAEEIKEAEARSIAASRQSPDQRLSPRPHLRRGHWHGYWAGPKTPPASGEAPTQRRFSLRWLPPMVVSLADQEE